MFERYTSKLLLSPKTSIGNYIFDVYLSITHQLSNQITEHPVQYGSNISDHILNQPDILSFQIGMSDCSQDLIYGQFETHPFKSAITSMQRYEGVGTRANIMANLNTLASPFKDMSANYRMSGAPFSSRSATAFNKLKEMKLKGEVFNCVTRLGTYKDMVIQSIEVVDDVNTKNGLLATVTCQQIFVASVEKVVVESTYQITKTTNSGIQSTRPLESVIHSKGGLLNALNPLS